VAVDVQQGTSQLFEIYPPGVTSAPASCTVSVYNSANSLIVSGAATVDSVSTTVSSYSAPQIVVASASGIGRRRYLLTSSVYGSTEVEVDSVVSTTLTLTDPPPFTPASGNTFLGLRIYYTLSSTYTATRGMGYRVEWAVTFADSTVRRYQTLFNVVYTPFESAVTLRTLDEFLRDNYPSEAGRFTAAELRQLASDASEHVAMYIRSTGRYPSLMGESDVFRRHAGMYAIQYVLAGKRMIPAGTPESPDDYRRRVDRDLREAIDRVIQSLEWYDGDDDRAVGAGESGPFTMRIVL